MFKVKIVATGEIQTVYGLNGTHFLMYNKELDWWFYKDMAECVPVEDGTWLEMNYVVPKLD